MVEAYSSCDRTNGLLRGDNLANRALNNKLVYGWLQWIC